MLMQTYEAHIHDRSTSYCEVITAQNGYRKSEVHTYLAGQVVPADQGLPSPLVSLGLHLDHLVLPLHLDHPSLEDPEQCIYWVC